MTPRTIVEITTGACTIQIRGKRSTRGWNVVRVDGAHSEHQGHRKAKDDAIQLAHDCCEPGVKASFAVIPVTK